MQRLFLIVLDCKCEKNKINDEQNILNICVELFDFNHDASEYAKHEVRELISSYELEGCITPFKTTVVLK